MIFKLITSSICLLSLFGGTMKANDPVPYDKIANQITNNSSDRLRKKYRMNIIGVKSGMMHCVNLMGIHFQVNRALSKEEARAIIVDCAKSFLADINQNESIRPFLKVYPFDLKHIEIIIFINTPDNGTFYHPDLSVVSVVDGKIGYDTNDPDHKYRYKLEETESFEDALKIVQTQASSNQTK